MESKSYTIAILSGEKAKEFWRQEVAKLIEEVVARTKKETNAPPQQDEYARICDLTRPSEN